MRYLELSKTPDIKDPCEIVNYLMDNNFIGIVNDISGNNVEYTLDDLLLIWSNLYNYKLTIKIK